MFGLKKRKKDRGGEEPGRNDAAPRSIPASVDRCLALLRESFYGSTDIVLQEVPTAKGKALVVYVDGLVNQDLLDRDVLRPLKVSGFDGDLSRFLPVVYSDVVTLDDAVEEVMDGSIVLFYEGMRRAMVMSLRQYDKRTVEPPDSEAVVRGPQEGFTESIRTNTALIRRKIKTPRLVMEKMVLGRMSKTTVILAYIDGTANREVLDNVRRRIQSIDTDAILESGNIEQYIEGNTFSPISGIAVTQKPDVAAQRLSDGHIAILTDGTPHVLTLPELFISNLITIEDNYNRPVYVSAMRALRFFALDISVMLPGLAIAIMTYHHEMMPSVFLSNVINASSKTPLPMAIEALLLILLFELIREAGTRMPKAVGSAITIVGSLIIGQAAVDAGIVSAPIVIVVAITAVASFMLPNLAEFILVYRMFFWLLGTFMGLIGVGAGLVVLLVQVTSVRSFDVPVLSSSSKYEMMNMLLRWPLTMLRYRPTSIAKENIKRR